MDRSLRFQGRFRRESSVADDLAPRMKAAFAPRTMSRFVLHASHDEGSTGVSHQDRLTNIVQHASPKQITISRRNESIRECLLKGRTAIDGENFTRVHPGALAKAFDLYDELVFDGCCREMLRAAKAPIEFRFSRRMTRTGGMTIRYEPGSDQGDAQTRYEIKLSATLLFQSFRDGRDLIVSGCRCTNRLDAMLRIIEHEMIHLIEMLLWHDSSCARRRFQSIAFRLFEHTESTHQLLTPVEVARDHYGIRPGDAVAFSFQGRRYAGTVNRITRRATVLVPDPKGERYSDGRHYRKFYVPLSALRRA